MMPTPSISCGGLEPFDKYFKIHASFFFSFFLYLSFLFTIIVTLVNPDKQTNPTTMQQGADRKERAASIEVAGCSSRAGSTVSMGPEEKTLQSRGMFPKLGCRD